MKSLRNRLASLAQGDSRNGPNSNEALIPHRRDFSALLSPLRAMLLVVALMSGADAVMILSRQRRINQTATPTPRGSIAPDPQVRFRVGKPQEKRPVVAAVRTIAGQ